MINSLKDVSRHVAMAIIIMLIIFPVGYTFSSLCFPKEIPEPQVTEVIRTEYIPYPKVIVIQSEPIETVVYSSPEKETELEFSDIQLIAKAVNAEAGNQDMIGKRLVVDVILNRYYDELFPNTIEDVIFSPGQFSSNIENAKYNDSDLEAVGLELIQRLDSDILYFRTEYFHENHKKAYQHGAHYFSYK